jgi:simple sugar transport system permease protein
MADGPLASPVPPARPEVPGRAGRRWIPWRETGILAVAVSLVLVFQVLNGAFLTPTNLEVILQQAAEISFIAVGEVMVMVLAEIDLSVGNVFALAPFVLYFAVQAHWPMVVGIALGLLAAGVVGLLNGLVTVRLQIPSFITTLGMLFALNGLTLIISGGYPVITPNGGAINTVMGAGALAPFLWAAGVVVAWHLLLTRTRFGVYTIAVGSNPTASREVGIDVGRVRVLNFVLVAMLAALIGIIEAFRITSIDPLAGGTDLLLQGISAAVIGGTALTGGSGTIIGAAIGSFVIAALQDGLNLLGVNAYAFDLILGLAILAAMTLNLRMARIRLGSRP